MIRRDKDYIPKVGGSAIRKAKETGNSSSVSKGNSTKGGPAASGKKKRAAWDIKGRCGAEEGGGGASIAPFNISIINY